MLQGKKKMPTENLRQDFHIGDELELTRERIRQIKKKGLELFKWKWERRGKNRTVGANGAGISRYTA